MATRNEVVAILALLADAYPQRTFTNPEGFAHTAATLLHDTDATALRQAAMDWIAEERFFPTIAELRQRAEVARKQQPKKGMSVVEMGTFAQIVSRWETQRPEDWTDDDLALFAKLMGRPVDWRHEDPNAPWMAWRIAQ